MSSDEIGEAAPETTARPSAETVEAASDTIARPSVELVEVAPETTIARPSADVVEAPALGDAEHAFAAERDTQPAAGLDAAHGSVFTARGRSNTSSALVADLGQAVPSEGAALGRPG